MRGSIEKRGNGYRVSIHLGYGEGGKPQRYREVCSTRKAAEDVLRAKLQEFETEGRISKRTNDTLADYITRWMEASLKPRVRERTMELYQEHFDRHISSSEIGKKPLKAIRPDELDDYYSGLLKKVGIPSVKHVRRLIDGAFKKAVRMREISHSPHVYLDPLPTHRKKPADPLELEDFGAFVGAAMQDRTGPLWVLLLATGMRPEEALGLRWSSVKGRQVFIDLVLVRPYRQRPGQPKWWLDDPKTKGSRRTVMIDAQVATLLKQWHTRQAEERLRAGSAWENHDFVFATELGAPLRYPWVVRTFKRICKQAGLSAQLTPYSLRHGAATGLLRKGEGLKVVSELLGHSSIKITGDVYAHVSPDQMDKVASVLGSAMFGR